MDSGLAVIMITDPSYSQLRLEIPQTMKDHCEYWGHSATGNVVGLNSTTDFKGEAVGPLPLVMVSLLRIVVARFSLLFFSLMLYPGLDTQGQGSFGWLYHCRLGWFRLRRLVWGPTFGRKRCRGRDQEKGGDQGCFRWQVRDDQEDGEEAVRSSFTCL